ncbi:hypothetical protein ONS95_006298 [Cadophora gregata]|uniref:uncharacterized protein n=1 Tax=Cadophora gregata TaxID=51156 RepID=UPI0026DB6848|nr:uncharacterized protein ONS95_006298 [Cadophora gregata]KAK0099341.1 hypothetical protein ONS96_008569 [Cadophora gregata f. sp. sojae]KAK0102697.1 hypothetical protein ONS95_006298 [Cadophora gregata]KAK0104351.1 hypothetical protein ONS96_005436 [Cadophora gregata f. sp. sojae]KAK0123609.1 hypothetical protein ONS96_010585 [Cadophora gregata f. sp. sojae]
MKYKRTGTEYGFQTKPAYGAPWTKALALWEKDDVGKYVVTNADNLALFSLSTWVDHKNGLYPSWPPARPVPDPTYAPQFFSEADAAANPDVHGCVTDDPNGATGPALDIPGPSNTENYIDCNNNGNIEWATAPSVSHDFATNSLRTFCDNVNRQRTATFAVPNTANRKLFLGALLQTDDPACTVLNVSPSECMSQMSNIFASCDSSSPSRKYGGVSVSGCVSWAAGVDGKRGAVKDPEAPFSCSLMVSGNSLNCACTDGELYPLLNETCGYVAPPSSPSSNVGGQQIAIASYTNPLGDPDAWERLISFDSGKVSILVANVLNGPDYVVDPSWKSVIQKAAASGKTVIGYVRTGYLGQAHDFKTRLGSQDLADWASQIEQDVDKWYELYPNGIGGIFFDEGWPSCGRNNIYSDLYTYINAYTKRKHPGAYTVLNPGSTMEQCFEDTIDTLLTFKNRYEAYISSEYADNTWTPKDDRKIWHIIYRVPQNKIIEVTELSRQRHVGYLEITDDNKDNPYDNVPNNAYMNTAMNSVPGGSVRKDVATALSGSYIASVPSDANVIASDYTSATITWSPVPNALGYAVY